MRRRVEVLELVDGVLLGIEVPVAAHHEMPLGLGRYGSPHRYLLGGLKGRF
jgi:hypothetical protein